MLTELIKISLTSFQIILNKRFGSIKNKLIFSVCDAESVWRNIVILLFGLFIEERLYRRSLSGWDYIKN